MNINGEIMPKNSPLIHLIGDLDELNAHMGLVKVKIPDESDKSFIETIQVNLIKLMSHIYDFYNEKFFFTQNETIKLENEINKIKEAQPKQFGFVIPGKSETEAFIHIARTVARRAERRFVSVKKNVPLNSNGADFLNELSSYLFVLSLKV